MEHSMPTWEVAKEESSSQEQHSPDQCTHNIVHSKPATCMKGCAHVLILMYCL